jgi:hypothetical protein
MKYDLSSLLRSMLPQIISVAIGSLIAIALVQARVTSLSEQVAAFNTIIIPREVIEAKLDAIQSDITELKQDVKDFRFETREENK